MVVKTTVWITTQQVFPSGADKFLSYLTARYASSNLMHKEDANVAPPRSRQKQAVARGTMQTPKGI